MAPQDSSRLPSTEPFIAGGQAVLSEFPRALVSRLLQDVTPFELNRGDVLYRVGEPSDTCYLVRRGVVKVSAAVPTGEQRILTLHGPGTVVGELSLIDGGPRGATAEAMSDCTVVVISRAAFLGAMAAQPEVYPEVVTALARRIRKITDETTRAAFLPMKSRIALALLRTARLLGRQAGYDRLGLEQNVSQIDLASMAGVTRESVNRTLADWKNSGVITSSDQFRLIVDVRRLAHLAVEGNHVGRPELVAAD
jgi:CRP/FNR family transcriptional regulator